MIPVRLAEPTGAAAVIAVAVELASLVLLFYSPSGSGASSS